MDNVPEHTVLPLSPISHWSLYSHDDEPVSKQEVMALVLDYLPITILSLTFSLAIPQSLLLNSVFFLFNPSLDESQTLFGRSFVGKACACWKSGQERHLVLDLCWVDWDTHTEKDVRSYSDAVCCVHGRYCDLLLKSPLQLGLRTGTINCTPG